MRIYIAGPMTGLPKSNYPAFNAAAARLRALGHHVENPAENPAPPCGSWLGYMRLALAQLVTCDHIALLPGWEASKGASVEWRLACDLGLPVSPVETFTAPVSYAGADVVIKVKAKASEKVKRFVLFAGRDYDHTAGGWREYVGDYDHLHEARGVGIASRMDWWNVIDLETGEEVANGD